MHARPIVLIACEPSETEVLRALVPAEARVMTATSTQEAVERMAEEIDAVICSMEFDESRMLDLVQVAHSQRPDLPVLCCRVFGSRISDLSLRAAAMAAFSIGVAAFIDLASGVPLFGADAAELAATLLRLLG
jgi:DNA-binding NtrC family response regulator